MRKIKTNIKRENQIRNVKKKIGVIFGGCSPEYKVSLNSSYSVITNINKDKYDVVLIGITKQGDFYLFNGDVEKIKSDTWFNDKDCYKLLIPCSKEDNRLVFVKNNKLEYIKIDACFPVLHGKNGEDGTLQGMLELLDIKFIGCDMLSSTLCMNKYISHKLVESYGIKVANSIVISKYENNTKQINDSINKLKYPLFIKPMRAGSSFGISKIYSKDEIGQALNKAFEYDSEVIVEENVDGIEIGVSILGNKKLYVGKIDEIEISNNFFDYKEKYTLKTSKIHVPARIDKETEIKAKEIAIKIYKILKCKDFARVDLFYTKSGEIYFNEVNTIPGFTTHSRYPNMMKESGINFFELVNKIIDLEV